MRGDLRFWFQGELVSLSGVSPQKTVLRWLREDKGLTGTKEGCGEGDCGACTVVVGSLDPAAPSGLRLRALNSCLLFLPALDGKALFTVEDVAGDAANDPSLLHPVQRALVDLHASQCGFCTPGFVMSLWADYEERSTAPSREETLSTLSGNLCRCTGYRPLIDAAQAAWDHPVVRLSRAPVAQALRSVAALPPLAYRHGDQTWDAPRTLDQLAHLAEAQPQARLVAGATDVGLWVTKGLKNLGPLISVKDVSELQRIEEKEGCLLLGAAVSLTDAFAALTQRHPELFEFLERFASTPVRNAGTLGGNVANGSPIGDSLPLLLALDASVVLRKGARTREQPLDEFYLDYQKTAREPGEVLTALHIPALAPHTHLRAYKVSKRRDQDISAVCGAFAVTLTGGVVTQAKLAFGGMAATARRAQKAETVLAGAPFDQAALEAAQSALDQEFSPLTDGRATADYRQTVAKNLLTRLQAELVPGEGRS